MPLERSADAIAALSPPAPPRVVGWQQLDRARGRAARGWRRSRPSTRSRPSRRSAAASRARASPAPRRTGCARDPVRVFVGVDAAADGGATRRAARRGRARAARRASTAAGSSSARRRCAATSTRSRVAAEERLAGGDVASVAVQYHDRRTLLHAAQGADRGAHAPRACSRSCAAARPPAAEICVYGESLGAWASQNVFRRGGVRALDEARVARALWIGTPYFSPLPRLLGERRDPDRRAGQLGRGRRPARGATWSATARFVFVAAAHGPGGALPRPGPDLAPAGLAAATTVDAGHHVPAAGLRPDRGDELAVDDAAGAGPRLPAGGAAARWTSRSATTRRARGSPSWPTGSSRTRSRAARGSEHCGARTAILQGIDNAFPDRVAARLKARRTTIASAGPA